MQAPVESVALVVGRDIVVSLVVDTTLHSLLVVKVVQSFHPKLDWKYWEERRRLEVRKQLTACMKTSRSDLKELVINFLVVWPVEMTLFSDRRR